MKGFLNRVKFTEKDLALFKTLAKLNQTSLKSMLKRLLSSMDEYSVYNHKKYIAAKGNIPIVLVAHMDTVFPAPPNDFYYDSKKGALWSPDGLGADDRAGVFAILKIIGSGLRPHILFTCDEEIGGGGACEAADNKKFFGDVKYVIQLDRRGSNDCVFYDCDNEEFIKYVENFGFQEAIGTFSDISIICPSWEVAGVNLSIGYHNEHSICEILMVREMMATVEKVKLMLQAKDVPDFIYVPSLRGVPYYNLFNQYGNYYKPFGFDRPLKCVNCGADIDLVSMVEVEKSDGSLVSYCSSCINTGNFNITWCYNCGCAYERRTDGTDRGLCYSCAGGYEFGPDED